MGIRTQCILRRIMQYYNYFFCLGRFFSPKSSEDRLSQQFCPLKHKCCFTKVILQQFPSAVMRMKTGFCKALKQKVQNWCEQSKKYINQNNKTTTKKKENTRKTSSKQHLNFSTLTFLHVETGQLNVYLTYLHASLPLVFMVCFFFHMSNCNFSGMSSFCLSPPSSSD